MLQRLPLRLQIPLPRPLRIIFWRWSSPFEENLEDGRALENDWFLWQVAIIGQILQAQAPIIFRFETIVL